jgi:Inner membrane component of T3SS, cytoplasmic domain
MFKLEFTQGLHTGLSLPLSLGRYVIGCDERCDVVVLDDCVNPQHLVLELSAFGAQIKPPSQDGESSSTKQTTIWINQKPLPIRGSKVAVADLQEAVLIQLNRFAKARTGNHESTSSFRISVVNGFLSDTATTKKHTSIFRQLGYGLLIVLLSYTTYKGYENWSMPKLDVVSNKSVSPMQAQATAETAASPNLNSQAGGQNSSSDGNPTLLVKQALTTIDQSDNKRENLAVNPNSQDETETINPVTIGAQQPETNSEENSKTNKIKFKPSAVEVALFEEGEAVIVSLPDREPYLQISANKVVEATSADEVLKITKKNEPKNLRDSSKNVKEIKLFVGSILLKNYRILKIELRTITLLDLRDKEVKTVKILTVSKAKIN